MNPLSDEQSQLWKRRSMLPLYQITHSIEHMETVENNINIRAKNLKYLIILLVRRCAVTTNGTEGCGADSHSISDTCRWQQWEGWWQNNRYHTKDMGDIILLPLSEINLIDKIFQKIEACQYIFLVTN